ncbi:MAG TPA: hypothetical protein VKX17_28535 [Planctomycetota bacterium]|nr:hypothetical protein [Planctomycetota bacterium]
MASAKEWSLAYAKQARADFNARVCLFDMNRGAIRTPPGIAVPSCHHLMLLQMSCEKLCKAHLCAKGTNPDDLTGSHAYVANVLPTIFRMQFARHFDRNLRSQARFVRRVSHLARQIELLAPAVRDGGRRMDNCEYPWEDAAGHVVVPAEYSFPNMNILKVHEGVLFLKLIEKSIDQLCVRSPSL